MPDVYEGDRPYIFACYAHADREAVLPMIRALVDAGYRVWWDDGIELTTRYPQRIADHVYGCARFVKFVSRASLDSGWCADETHYALDLKKTVLPVYLEDVELTRDLQMRMSHIQSLFRSSFSTDEALSRRLCGERMLYCCLTNDGRRDRGAKPRGDEVGSGGSAGKHARVIVSDGPGGAPKVARKDKLADYTWAELKELSQAIAAAGSDEEGLGIAKEYNLADKDGRLWGDTKEVELGDKGMTKARVRILGFRHDELVSGGKAGISFEFADVPARHRMNPTGTNAGGWEGSGMRKWLNDAEGGLLGLLPADLRSNVAEARKRTNNRGKVEENDIACVTATDDRLWLLSAYEVYGGVPSWMYSPATYAEEGSQYRLYVYGGVTVESYSFCQKREAISWWWLRSPSANGSGGFHIVYDVGDWNWDYANLDWGVSPGFCF